MILLFIPFAFVLYWMYNQQKAAEQRIAVLEQLIRMQKPSPAKEYKMTKKEAKDILPSSWSHCDTKDKFGRHCPEMPVHEVYGLHLCERCFLNYQSRNKKKQFGEKLVEGFNPAKPETLRPNQVRGREVDDCRFEFDVKVKV